MNLFRKKRRFVLAASVALLLAAVEMPLKAASGTWIGATNDWTTNSNWTAAFPNGAAEVATFDGSAVSLTPRITGTAITVGGITMSVGAPAITLSLDGTTTAATLTFEGAGLTNNATTTVNFVVTGSSGNPSGFTFNNSASAGAKAIYTLNTDGFARFTGTSSGGTASFVTNAGSTFDISQLTGAGMSVGLVSGAGSFRLGSKNLSIGGNNTSTTVSGVIADGGLGGGVGGSLTKVGTATLTLSGANTYTGGTTLDNGTLIVNNNSALGTGTLTITSAGGAATLGSTVANTTITNNVVVQGNFSVATNVDSGNPGNQNFTFAGPMDLGGTTRTITGTTASGQVHFAGVMSNGGVTLVGTGPYVAFIYDQAVANTYSGLTTVGQDAFLVLNSTAANGAVIGDVLVTGNGSVDYFRSDQIADTSSVTVNSTGLDAGTTHFEGFEMRNMNETIASLSGTGTVGLGSGTLTVGAGNFSGVIQDGDFGVGGNLTKVGAGILTLSGVNIHTGVTTVSGGVLNLNTTGGGAIAGNVAVAGGELVLQQADQIANTSTISISAGTLNLGTNNETVAVVQLTGGTIAGTTGVLTSTTAFDLRQGTVSAILGGSAGLNKTTAGTVTLDAANTYTGATTVNAGTLVIDTVTNASVLNSASDLVLGGGTIQLKGVAATVQSQVFLNGLTLAAGASAVVINNNGGTSTTLDLSGTGGLAGITRIGDATVDFSASSGTFGTDAIVRTGQANNASGIIGGWATVNGSAFAANNGSGVIVAYTGYTDIDALGSVIADGTNTNVRINSTGAGGNVTLGAPTTNINTLTQNNGTASTIDTTGGTLRLGVEGAIITTATGGLLTIGTAPNAGTLTAGGNAIDVAGEIVVGNFSPNAITINSTITNNGTGVVSLTKTGTGTLTVTGTNTYTGVTTVNGGVMNLNATGGGAIAGNVVISGGNLVLQQADQIADTSTISISAGVLNIGTNSETVAGVQLINGTISGTTGVLTSTTAFDLRQGTVSAILGGSAGLNKTTAGTLILSRVNTYTGATSITGGTLQAGAANVITTASAVTVGTGATFNLNNFNQSIGSLAGGGAVTLGTAGLTTGSDNTSTTFSGIIQGAGGLTKVGTGTQTLSGANTYSGGTTLNNGGLFVDHNSALGTGTLTITSAGGATTLGSNVANTTISNSVLVQGNFSIATNVNVGTPSNQNFTLSGPVDLGGGVRTITGTTSGGRVRFEGVISNGEVTFLGGGVPAVFFYEQTVANTYSGLTTVGQDAILALGSTATNGAIIGNVTVMGNGSLLNISSDQISDNSSVTVNSTGSVFEGTQYEGFELRNFNETISSLSGTGTVGLGSGTLTVSSGNFDGVIKDGAFGTGGKLTKIGLGTLALGGANTYTGATTVKGGVLQADLVNAFSAASTLIVDPAGTVELNNFNQSVGTLADGTGGGGVVNLAGATLTVGASNASSAFSGTINGTGGLTKVGAGVFNLKGTNNYTGTTAVNGGALVLDSALTGPVTVNGAEFDINATASVTRGAGVTGVAADTGGTVNNLGVITVGDDSVGISAITNNKINNTKTITGGATGSVGVLLSGAGNTFTNEVGAIVTATTGILLTNPTGTNTIVNRGTITGTGGIAINNSVSTGAMNLTNFGTINGAVLFGTGGDTLTFVTRVPTFAANGGGGSDTLRLVGTRADTLNMGSITNFENLVKLGGGNWTLVGDGIFTGGTTVQQGNLYVQGNLRSNVLVMHEGFLGGNGIIRGNVTNFGIVSPGNSIGKITIQGDYLQNKSGTLVIEVRGKKPGDYDVLSVSGRAQLDGTLRIERVGKSPRLKIGDRLEFLTATNGVDGEFSDVRNPLTSDTMVQSEVVYEKNAVVIAGVQGSYAEFADKRNLTPNQRATAEAVDAAAFERKGSSKDDKMVEYLNERTLDKIPGDLDRVAPEEIAAVYRMGVAMADTQGRNIQHRAEEIRLTNRRPLRAPTPPVEGAAGAVGNEQVSAKTMVRTESEDRWGSFFTGSGQVARVGRTDNARDYDMDTGGVTVGVDYRVTPNLVIGVSAGYANTTAHLVGDGRIQANSGKLGVYGTYFKEGFHADAAVTGGFSSYETSREGLGGMARGKTEGQEFSTLIGAGYEWGEKAFKLGPTATVQYTYLSIDEFTERGSLAPVKVMTQHEESVRSTLGMKTAYEWNLGQVLVRPELLVAWQHEYGERNFTLDSTLASGAGGVFRVNDSGLGRDSLLLSAGVSVLWESGTVMYLFYDGDLGRKEYEAHNLSGGVRLTF